ncbi:MAG TPA: penicillin-binding protein 2 [Solirubrobacteraceae bacterium]|nr:penicillin-binding protein 2 [Solirubrobacteraceae bacterium]
MNRPIIRLYGLVAVLFALLVAFTSRWTIFEAASLRENPENERALLEQERVDRGQIVAADGAVLARSVRGAEGVYQRVYPTGGLFAAPVGYSFIEPPLGSTGIEKYRNNELNGQSGTNLQSVLDKLQGKEPQGEKVITTLQPAAQRAAITALGEHRGAVVAIEPRSGAVTVMASSPGYDPNELRSQRYREGLSSGSSGRSLDNRATLFGYAPGSTFKIVTATAAIDTGEYTPESLVSGPDGIIVSGLALHNDNDASFGPVTLTYALAHSINTVYAQVAEHVGKATLGRYMERFGFDRKPQLDFPSEEMTASGEHEGESIVPPTSPKVDVGRMGIGQDKLEVTPLQMAEVAAAVANHGTLMVPHLTQRIVDAEGETTKTISPRVQSVVMKPSTAGAVRTMMEAVVNEGTGEAAKIPGIQVAGKTGTAQTQFGDAINNVWFIAFAPAANPRVALAVTLEAVPGEGATYAAPVARAVIESLLHD